ncbi:GIY-YIG nuclease family protein [Patescibacteria group bacterium]|nr:GIY-YIG nuclease family protein [Patescibacteria group bacterium]
MYYVYLLQSQKDKKYYIGYTSDIHLRLKQHNKGLVRATKHRIPLTMIGFEEYENRNEARWREHTLKKSSWKRKNFISKFINNIN